MTPLASVEAALDLDNLTNRLRKHAAAQQNRMTAN